MDALSVALEYRDAGLAPIPVPRASKKAVIPWRQWHDRSPGPADLRAMFRDPSSNVGIVCGRSSGNLLVLDCENPRTFSDIGVRLAFAGIVTWTTQRPPNGSDHDGGGHYWLRTPKPVTPSHLDGMELRGQGQYVLAPPSVHPAGGQYEFIVRPSAIFTLPSMDALDWLELVPSKAYRPIPRRSRRLLAGDPSILAEYPSRSEAEAALCASLARAGFDFSDALRLLSRSPGPGKFDELYQIDPDNARRYLYLTWRNALEFIETHERPAIQLARDLRQWAESQHWPGLAGATDRAMYLAHLSIVEKCGAQPHAASCRRLAELTGVSWSTASKSNGRLQDAGLLELAQGATALLSNTFRLVEIPECASPHTSSPTPVMKCELVHASHDVFRHSGLGKTGAEMWAVLLDNGKVTEKQLREATGRHRTTVKRKLGIMFRLGMAEPLGDGLWQALPGVDLDEVAEQLGTAGLGAAQREKHERDRILHGRALEHFNR